MSTTPPELSRINCVRVPRRMYVSKFQRYGGAAIVVVLAVLVVIVAVLGHDGKRALGHCCFLVQLSSYIGPF